MLSFCFIDILKGDFNMKKTKSLIYTMMKIYCYVKIMRLTFMQGKY